MTGLLFAIVFWGFVMLCGFVAVLVIGFVVMMLDDLLNGPAIRRHRAARRVPPRALVPLRPFDQDDPLERAFLLPAAPDPRRRVR